MEIEIKSIYKEILARLAKLQTDMNVIKEHFEESTLTEDDLTSIQEAKRDLREKKTRRL